MRDRILAKLRMPDGTINPWVIAVSVTLATFMEGLDTSIANVALPHLAGRGRRGVAAERASDLERHFRAGEAWHGVCGVWARRGCGANHRAVAGRMDYRQLFVEMDFLHQRTGGDRFAGADQLFDQRPAVYEESECESGIPDRLHRHRVDQPGPREHADYSRQGTARGLAVVEFHSRFFRADDFWADRGNPLGIA